MAVVDSGIDDTHPALSSQSFCEKRCLATADLFTPGLPGNDPSVDDVNGHGTHVAGIVASTNSTYTGVAFGLDKVFNCKAGFDGDGVDGGGASMYWSDAMSCVDWALVSNTTCGDFADGVNLSYGGSTSADDTSFARFWDAVVDDLGIPVSISAGNSGPGANTLGDPSIAYNVMCVANMDDNNSTVRSDDVIRTSSSRGPTAGGRKKPDITAPGTNILSTDNTWESLPDWISYSGTSMAAPHMAGAQLLMTEYFGKQPMVQKAVLINTADDWGTTDWDSTYGWGYLDLSEAEFNKDDWFRTTVSPAPDYDLYKGLMYSGEKATLVWNRRVDYNASFPSTYYALSDLDLRLYNENTNSQLDYSTSVIDNVEQVQTTVDYAVVIKVNPFSISFAGNSTETYALATEENFTAASGPVFGLGTSNYNKCVGEQWTVNVTGNNTGDLIAHGAQISLTVPAGVSITSGSNPQSVGSIPDGTNKIATWTMQADAAGNHNVPVAIGSSSYGENFTGASSLSVDVSDVSDVPAAPVMISPGNGSRTGDTTPYFDWSSVMGGTSYQIQVDDDPGFSSPEIDASTVSSAYTPPSDLP
ncbi:MAG: S8 family serine peptidase, partial [Anaerolineae bacterium]